MNKHIELVKKWLADKDSVSYQELSDTVAAAYAAYAAAVTEAKTEAVAVAAEVNTAAADAAAAHWVKKYEELTK